MKNTFNYQLLNAGLSFAIEVKRNERGGGFAWAVFKGTEVCLFTGIDAKAINPLEAALKGVSELATHGRIDGKFAFKEIE